MASTKKSSKSASAKNPSAKKQPAKSPSARSKSTRKDASAKVGWAQAMRDALDKKKSGGWPDAAKPRDPVVQKVKKNAF